MCRSLRPSRPCKVNISDNPDLPENPTLWISIPSSP
jgi:hypothetical protein